ncbi:kinesin-like protein KIF19 isoform X1 [Canis lupus familiaris]|uniref:Kinesin-like protein n=2 Tax=Canis lupus familiaris TaxID=9615 RepID=A0A8P0SSG4_CANLF|nr:kinesin-like protein KIF19 isoform X1 [Canis lupus familiaris]|eukprot:XP_540404.3 kinesin-like protein KIF19 isoform X1 [Canis lupus familiaris]
MKDSGDSKDQQLMVALRVRPISVAELEEGATLIAHKVDEQMVVLMDPMEDPDDILRAHRSREKSYLFDVAFDFTATQEMVYQATTKSLIDGVISGYNATVFAYGPTGCGKTYTMLGTDHEPGIYVRTLNDLFRAIEETSNDMEYEVSMSYLEIYNEMIRDLLNPALGYLELREDSKGVIQVAGITEVSTINAKEIMQLLMKGNRQRTQEPTAANQTSSRSHAVLQVAVRQRSRVKNVLQEVRQGRLFMIDLAGSERASQTQNRGQRMKEGAHINRSLLALGNCINALSDKSSNKYINYRDSKLTRLLKDSLGGNSRTVMIAHISPASSAFEESRNTLTYAGRAKNIKTRVKQNLLNVSYHIAQYTSIISDLRGEIQRLKCKIDEQGGRGPAQGRLERGDIRHIQAEVQLHSAQGEQAEMGQLREQLISAFQEQMDVRRRLLELENHAMEVQIDTSRHLLTIAGWEHEKSRRALKWREEQRKESYTKDDSEKDSDTGDDQPDTLEPPEVASARESIAALVGEQKKLRKQKLALEQRCRELRARGRRLEETLPRRIGSEEQRQVLSLLCRVHELEVENTEMQSHALLRDGALRHRREAVRRLEQHRSLCDEIIQGQRQVIDDYNLAVPQHLEELYEVYLRELEEGSLERATIMDRVASRALQDSSLPKITPAGTTLTPESDPENVKTLSSEVQRLQDSILPPLSAESEANRVFKASPRAWQVKSSSVPTPPPIQIGSLVTQEAPTQDSLVSPSSQITSSPDSSENLSEIPLSSKERKEILTGTKCISVKAARRRSRALGSEGRHLLPPARERGSLSPHSPSEADEQPPGPLACKRPPSPTLQHAASEDNLSSSTGEAPSQAAGHSGDGTGPWMRSQKKSPGKKREESLEAKRRKRRSRSFEVTGQGLSRPKTHLLGPRPMESVSDHRVPVCGHPAPGTRHLGKVTLPLAKVKLPPSQSTGPGDSSPLTVHSNPAGISRRAARGPRLAHGISTHGKDGRFRHT